MTEPATRTSDPILLRDDREGVTTLTLNRPAARNALSRELLGALRQELESLGRDSAARVVVIAGAGPVFSAGHDLREIQSNGERSFREALLAECASVMTAIHDLPQPVIARVHGIATAAGCQLVAACDLAIASSAARFATPGVQIGLFCSTPMVELTRSVSAKHAMEMLLTGEMIDAEAALRFGLVNRVVPPDRLDDEVETLARKLASKSRVTVAIGKKAFYRQREMPLEEAYAYASRVMVENLEKRDAAEGIEAFLAKRPPAWKDR